MPTFHDFHDIEVKRYRDVNRATSTQLLSRLVRYHGAHPPDAESAHAMVRIRRSIRAVMRAARVNAPRRRRVRS